MKNKTAGEIVLVAFAGIWCVVFFAGLLYVADDWIWQAMHPRPGPFSTRAACEHVRVRAQEGASTPLSCEEMAAGGWSICGTVEVAGQDEDRCD